MFEATPNVDSQTAHENMPDHVPGSIMALLVGALNTEAKCITFASIPDVAELTPVATIRSELAKNGAYDLIDSSTYNAQGIIRKMDTLLVNVVSDSHRDPVRASMWVQKDQAIGPFATGVAGALLDVSLTHNMPLRRLLGEQFTTPQVNAIETRLGTLCTFASLATSGELIDRIAVGYDIAQQQGVNHSTARRHVDKLIESGILTTNRLSN